MLTIQEIFNERKSSFTEDEKSLIRRAFEAADRAHRGQKRKSGEAYINHCLSAAEKVSEWNLDAEVIAAALLHDTVEDTPLTIEELRSNFGENIAFLVNGVSRLGYFKYREKNEKKREEVEKAENFRKMILAISEDLRVIFIKFADRLHNMQTLQAVAPEKQRRIALETKEVYASLAYRLGMSKVAGELEDYALPYLYPADYKWLMENVAEKFEEREIYLNEAKKMAADILKQNGVLPISIGTRAKRYSSIHKKLKRYNMNIDEIYDLVAIRIVVETVEECYKVLGLIHQSWPPLPGKIKDYIALPKPNGYQSLHTTVFCLHNKITEFQIRTPKMHEEAEYGIAAHWAYDEGKKTKAYLKRRVSFADKKELAWIGQLREWQETFGEGQSRDYLNSLKIDFFNDRIFAVTPKGDVIDLPAGATPVDFAYQIHSDIGDQCAGAKVNGRFAPLHHILQSGDMVEIMKQKNKKPSASWLGIVKTSIARDHIKRALREKRNFLQKIATRAGR